MDTRVKPIPAGYHSVTPYLSVKGAAEAIEFYKRAFGAQEEFRMPDPSGRIGHAEIAIGDSRVMLADEYPEINFRAPQNWSPVHIHLYVEDSDSVFNQAVSAGAKILRPIKDEFYGDRIGTLEDPFGHVWHVATHKEDLSPEELKERAAAAMSSSANPDSK